uniref:Integrase catalytic domain-containing protein n=1 Tax=Strongyloides papillosus TaxID=174720 RepID=A0A0N5BU72_STREA
TQEEVIDGKKHYNIISFYSRALSKAEQRYPAMELECLAAVSTLQAMRYQLWGLPIQIISDNKQLCSLLISGNLSLRLLKWSMLLGEFNISNIVYLPGSKNVIADAMSRVIEHCDIPDDEEFPTPILSVCSISELTNKIPNECEWYRIQNTDEIFLELRKNVLNKSTTPKLTDEFGKKQFEIGKNGLITYNKKIVLNKEYATYILKMIHETNHINAESMCSQFDRVYYAKNRTVLALNIVRDCKTCFHNKEIITNRKVIEKEKVDKPFELGSMDYGYSECYKQYFLLLRDGFSNFAYATWVKNFSSKVIIQFLESIFQNYAVYKNIKCDNQTGFKSNEIRKYLESKGVNIKFSNSYEKWSNGKAERAIKSIKNHLKIFYKLNKSKGIALQLAISKSRDTIYHHEKSPRELHFNTSNLSSINTIRDQNTLNFMRYIWKRGNYKVNDEKKDCDIIAQIGKKTFIIKDKEKFIKTTLVNVGKEKIPDHEKKELAKKVQPFLRTENFFSKEGNVA